MTRHHFRRAHVTFLARWRIFCRNFTCGAHTHRSAFSLSANLIGIFRRMGATGGDDSFRCRFSHPSTSVFRGGLFLQSSSSCGLLPRDRKAIFVKKEKKKQTNSVPSTYGIGCNPPAAHPLRAVNFHCLQRRKQIDTRANWRNQSDSFPPE